MDSWLLGTSQGCGGLAVHTLLSMLVVVAASAEVDTTPSAAA